MNQRWYYTKEMNNGHYYWAIRDAKRGGFIAFAEKCEADAIKGCNRLNKEDEE